MSKKGGSILSILRKQNDNRPLIIEESFPLLSALGLAEDRNPLAENRKKANVAGKQSGNIGLCNTKIGKV